MMSVHLLPLASRLSRLLLKVNVLVGGCRGCLLLLLLLLLLQLLLLLLLLQLSFLLLHPGLELQTAALVLSGLGFPRGLLGLKSKEFGVL